jgi:hypothetical protein
MTATPLAVPVIVQARYIIAYNSAIRYCKIAIDINAAAVTSTIRPFPAEPRLCHMAVHLITHSGFFTSAKKAAQ